MEIVSTCATTCFTRRHVLSAGVAGIAVAAVAGCSSYGDEQPASPPAGGSAGGAGGSGSIATVADVPVGGALIIAAQKVVLTQPEAGTIKAFSATCTHQGCTVTGVEGGKITCPCHGSAFNVADGSVATGPATAPLPAVKVTVSGDAISLA